MALKLLSKFSEKCSAFSGGETEDDLAIVHDPGTRCQVFPFTLNAEAEL
jgi:hypothetical protein